MSFVAVGAGIGYLGAGAVAGGMTAATGAMVGGLAGTAAGAVMANNRGGPSAPQADPRQIGQDALSTQLYLAPEVLRANQLYGPQYTNLTLQQQRQGLLGNFDAGSFEKENPGFYAEYQRLQDAGEIRGWTPAQFAASWLGKQENDPALSKYYSGGTIDLYRNAQPGLSEVNASANRSQRTADINDVMALGPQARAAYLAANPELAAAMGGLDSRIAAARNVSPTQLTSTNAALPDPYTVERAGQTSLTPRLLRDAANYSDRSALQTTLERQAADELGRNGELSLEDIRDAQQTARGASQARGIYDSNSAMAAEVLNTAAMKRDRRNEARTFAGAVDAAGQQQLNAGRGFALGVEGAEQNRNMFNAGQGNSASAQIYGTTAQMNQFNAGQEATRQLNQAQLNRAATNDQFGREFQLAGMYQGQATDPFNVVLGRSGVPGQAAGAVGQAGMASTAGPQFFNPFNSDITSIYAGNQANQTAANIAGGNNNAAMTGSILNFGGQLGASALPYMLAPCWVARAAFGVTNPRWVAVQRWMVMDAPRDLFILYATHGPQLAEQLVADGRRGYFRSLLRRLITGDERALRELTAELHSAAELINAA